MDEWVIEGVSEFEATIIKTNTLSCMHKRVRDQAPARARVSKQVSKQESKGNDQVVK